MLVEAKELAKQHKWLTPSEGHSYSISSRTGPWPSNMWDKQGKINVVKSGQKWVYCRRQ